MEILWTAPDGTTFPTERWEPRGHARGVLIYVHGMGGAGSEFQTLAEQAAWDGWAGFAINLRGQGLDPVIGRRGTELPLDQIEKDIIAFAGEATAAFPHLPVYWCGESMGALILAHLLSNPNRTFLADGAIFSAPVVQLRKPVSPVLRPVVRLIAALIPRFRLRPSLFVTGKSTPVMVSRDEEFRTKARQSAHYIPAFSIGFLNSLGNLIERSKELACEITIPSLVLIGRQDIYVKVEQIQEWYDELASRDKTLKVYPHAYHCLWNDLDRDQVITDVLSWLTEQKPASREEQVS